MMLEDVGRCWTVGLLDGFFRVRQVEKIYSVVKFIRESRI
jgi:hypothetical protein